MAQIAKAIVVSDYHDCIYKQMLNIIYDVRYILYVRSRVRINYRFKVRSYLLDILCILIDWILSIIDDVLDMGYDIKLYVMNSVVCIIYYALYLIYYLLYSIYYLDHMNGIYFEGA